MTYVRRRGNQLAIVCGTRHPDTRKVEQTILFTFYSKAEALEVLGRGSPESPDRFQSCLAELHPATSFDWPKLTAAIEQNLDALPETYDSVGARLRNGFGPELRQFARRLIFTDPQHLTSNWELIDEHRYELEFVRDLIDWRLAIDKPRPEASEWMADNPFHWRQLMVSRMVPPEVEELAAHARANSDPAKSEAVFSMLVEIFQDYAEGHNYLGLIAYERGDYELAISRFKKCIELGRTLFPKRMPKDLWWIDIATRPFIRGLGNLALAYNHAGLYADALSVCDRLRNECYDEYRASTHEAAARLSLGEWEAALEAALRIHRDCPEESLVAAFAAHELGRAHDARVFFVHAMMGAPRTVEMFVNPRYSGPEGPVEIADHNGGVALHGSIRGYFERRSPKAEKFFKRAWKDSVILRAQFALAEQTSKENRGAPGRAAFDSMQEMRTLEFAQKFWKLRGGR